MNTSQFYYCTMCDNFNDTSNYAHQTLMCFAIKSKPFDEILARAAFNNSNMDLLNSPVCSTLR